jgi:hypothetical protein
MKETTFGKRSMEQFFKISASSGTQLVRTLKPTPTTAMKHQYPHFIGRLTALLMAMILCFSTILAGAESKDTYWTSVDGVTIWASLTGIHGSTVVLVMRGREYQVPVSRLTPESVAKARRLLGASPAPVVVSRPKITPSTPAVASCPKIKPSTTAVATCPMIKPSSNTTPGEWSPVLLDESPTPSGTADAETDSYVGVLPEKGEILPPSALPPLPLDPPVASGSKIRLEGRLAIAPSGVPSIIRTAIAAGNRLQDKFYKWGGGRSQLEDNGYDCSGSVSYVLIKAGLLRSPLTSGTFMKYGEAGRGQWITIYAKSGHVFMTLCGLRLDTGGHAGKGESGPRWCPNSRDNSGFVMRHPPGF